MGKITPEERWYKHIMERYTALRQSGELKKLQAEGLYILKRTKLFTAEEWSQTFRQRAFSPEYRVWKDKCNTLGERYGLAPYVVTMACLLEGYQPEDQPFVIEAPWPQVRVVTVSDNQDFLARLACEAQRLGLYVVQRHGSIESTYVFINPVPFEPIEPPPMPLTKPPANSAFYLRVETPPGYPPEAASSLHKRASKLERELRRRLGYPTRERLRTSSLVPLADELRISDGPLPSGGIYDIIDEVYGDNDSNLDQPRRKLIKARRHKLQKLLVQPYKLNAG